MINSKYDIHDQVNIKGSLQKYSVHEISKMANWSIQYRLWQEGTVNYDWFEEYQIGWTYSRIGFKVD